MIQIIAAILVAIWFFESARKVGKNGISWAIIGILALILPSILWVIISRVTILPALMKTDIGPAGAIISGLAIGLVGVGLGLVVVFWIYKMNLKSNFHKDPPTVN